MAIEPESSVFLRALTKWINKIQVTPEFRVSPSEFYNATLGTYSRDPTKRIPGELIYNGTPEVVGNQKEKKPDEFNATLGGFQISTFLASNEAKQLGVKLFEDDYFVGFMLNMYSNIKVYNDGTSKSYSYGTPDIFTKDNRTFLVKISDCVNVPARPASRCNWKYGIFETKQDIENYDNFLKDRIAPVFLGSTSDKPYLPELLIEHLGQDPKFEDASRRRLFLLMGGQYYGQNDRLYLNIMEAKDETPYSNIPKAVRDYWKKHYPLAAQLEKPPSTPQNVALKELLGAEPSLQTFAKIISHGLEGKTFSSKIKSIQNYNDPNFVVPEPAFATTGPSNKVLITAVFPKYIPLKEPRDLKTLTDFALGQTDPGVLVLIGRRKPDSDDITYLGNFPRIKTTGFRAAGTTFLLSKAASLSSVEASGVPVLPTNIESTDVVGYVVRDATGDLTKGVVEAAVYDNWRNRQIVGPPVGELFDIPKENTILDFQPSKNTNKLAMALKTAVATEVGETVQFDFQSDEWVNTIYAPLESVNSVISKEYAKLQKRLQIYEQIFSGKEVDEADKEANTKNLTLENYDVDDPDKEEYRLQLWIDAINVASLKTIEWIRLSQTNATVWVRWLSVLHLVNKNKNKDQIAQILKDTNLQKGKPSDQSKRAFKIELPNPPTPAPDPLSPDEAKKRLESRTKNIDQCLISTNIEPLKLAYRRLIATEIQQVNNDPSYFTIHKKTHPGYDPVATPYGGRFHLLSHSDGKHSTIPNLLTAPVGDKIRPFLNATPDIQSALTPKIRLYRVTTEGSKDVETEFVFNNFITKQESNGLKDGNKIQKGRGGGIKSFSFSYEGGTPATAKKDINAELVLYFQSFGELTKTRYANNRKYRYIDLLLYPTNGTTQADKSTAGDDSIHPAQYNPTSFRIRADVGWNIRNGKDDPFKRMIEARGMDIDDFNQSLRLINKTFLLNMIDHDIDFRNDGSVEIKITYAAYIESMSRTTKANALSTPQIEFFKRQANKEIEDVLKEEKCSPEELNSVRALQSRNEINYTKAAQGSIVKRLITRGLQRTVVFSESEVKEYLKDFATAPPELKGDISLNATATKDQREVHFYFLGDIVHTIMDCLYEPVSKLSKSYDPKKDNTLEFITRAPELEKYSILLSSFIYSDFNTNPGKPGINSANIADMPISVQYFNEWLVDNVIKSERKIYPLTDFIKDILRALVDLITDACINRQIDTSLMFQTMQLRAIGVKKGEAYYDPIENIRISGRNITSTSMDMGPVDTSLNQLVYVDEVYKHDSKKAQTKPKKAGNNLDDKKTRQSKTEKADSLPLKSGDFLGSKRVPIEGYYNYTLIYPVSPTLSTGHNGVGIRTKDENEGTYHFVIGSDKGLLKNVKFTKTDMAYLREARYYNQGNYGLLQLGAVYNVELELFGNTLFYPGMEIFIDPRGFGPDWNPVVGGRNRSVANALGIGGYHIITKVNSTISPSGFTTTITAVFQYSGDSGSKNVAIDGETTSVSKKTKVSQPSPKKPAVKCVEIYQNALKHSVDLEKAAAKTKRNKKGVIPSKP